MLQGVESPSCGTTGRPFKETGEAPRLSQLCPHCSGDKQRVGQDASGPGSSGVRPCPGDGVIGATRERIGRQVRGKARFAEQTP